MAQPPELSDEDIQMCKEAFDQFDASDDGHISKDELRNVMQQAGEPASDRDVNELMQQADKNNSGTIEWLEFLKCMTHVKRRQNLNDDQIESVFAIFDEDGDGLIARPEMERAVASLGLEYVYHDEVLDELFGDADSDGDGLINKDEYVAALRNKM